jgi:hypothetical protein
LQESNIILAQTYEYRMPNEKAKKEALEKAQAGQGNRRADMTSRFVGLVVVPGKHIVKLEVEMKQAEPWEGPMALRGSRVGQPVDAASSGLAKEQPQDRGTPERLNQGGKAAEV